MAKAKVTDTEETEQAGIAIESASLHSSVMIPGVTTEVNLNKSKLPDIKMRLMPFGLQCWSKGKEWIVPTANIKSMMVLK